MARTEKSNNDHWLDKLIKTIRIQEDQLRLGGGTKRIKKEHAKGKLTARERISLLIDDGSAFYEIGLWAGYEMYDDVGGCPAGGVVTGVGTVSGRLCMIVANDATVKGWCLVSDHRKKECEGTGNCH